MKNMQRSLEKMGDSKQFKYEVECFEYLIPGLERLIYLRQKEVDNRTDWVTENYGKVERVYYDNQIREVQNLKSELETFERLLKIIQRP
jgi:hypothetical protein